MRQVCQGECVIRERGPEMNRNVGRNQERNPRPDRTRSADREARQRQTGGRAKRQKNRLKNAIMVPL